MKKEALCREKQFKKCIDEYKAMMKKDRESMEIKEAHYQAKLEEMAKQIDAIKAESTRNLQPCAPQPSARKSLGYSTQGSVRDSSRNC